MVKDTRDMRTPSLQIVWASISIFRTWIYLKLFIHVPYLFPLNSTKHDWFTVIVSTSKHVDIQ